MPFNSAITNIGNHYNFDSDSFICPYNGLYSFFVSVNEHYDDHLRAAIYRESTKLMQVDFDNEHGRDSSSAHAFTSCSAGDEVYVYVSTGGEFDANFSPTHFSGFLLRRD